MKQRALDHPDDRLATARLSGSLDSASRPRKRWGALDHRLEQGVLGPEMPDVEPRLVPACFSDRLKRGRMRSPAAHDTIAAASSFCRDTSDCSPGARFRIDLWLARGKVSRLLGCGRPHRRRSRLFLTGRKRC